MEDAEVTGAVEIDPALVVTRTPPAHCLGESYPRREFTVGEEASSSSSSGKAPMPEAPLKDHAPATQAAKKKEKKKTKKKVIMPQSRLDALMTVDEWEPLSPLDKEWLKAITALIPNGEQYFADSMDFAVKAQTDMIAELRKQQQEKGYVEMEVTDDEEEVRAPAAGRGRRRFRLGVCKKPGGEIKRLN